MLSKSIKTFVTFVTVSAFVDFGVIIAMGFYVVLKKIFTSKKLSTLTANMSIYYFSMS